MDTASRVNPLRRGDPGRLGEYRMIGRLGSGGMGVVYLATDRDDNLVAIKLVHATLVHDPEFRGRFRSEVERARQVPSFCTAEVLDADLDHNPPYLVVEYVDGPSLADVVEESGPLKAAALHSLAVGVVTALTGIHGAGVIHRDLKPGNVLLAPGSPKVIDFGIARAFEATSQHTRTDQMVGTVAYMAPERFSSEPGTPLTAAADVFAWGCVVAYAGTGRTPFHGDSPPATAARILTQPPHLGGLTEPLRGLVELSLSKRPEDRPTARELLDLLLGERPPERRRPREDPRPPAGYGPAYPAYAPPAPARRGRGHRVLAVLAILLVIAGLATVALVVSASGVPRIADGVQTGLDDPAAEDTGPADPGEPDPETPPATAPAGPVPVAPEGGEPIISDQLSRPGLWQDSEVPGQDADCVVQGVLRVSRADRGAHQCAGPEEVIKDDFGVEVTTVLQSAGSCAAVWFHWDPKDGGQVLRVCQGEISVGADLPDDSRVYGRIPLERRITLRGPTRIHLVVRDGEAQVFRGGDFAGAVPLPADGPDEGQVLLGLDAQADGGPFTVTFADVDIRSL
ncbi:serine/threonine-protein kinase [Actinoplanes sp. NPDC026623]|uniref:serine/threonine protein kinase n=1 Tax=Actinoplanes sp. NPDC026623 TaxID=3155610 RepID=UPI003409C426